MVTEATIGIRSKNDLQDAAKSNGTTLSMVDCRPLDREGMVMLLEIEGSPEGVDKTMGTIRSMAGVRQIFEEGGVPGRVRVLAVLDKPGVCRASTGSVVICVDCPFNSTEVPAKWSFATKRSGDLLGILRRLSEEGVDAQVEKVSPFGSNAPFTENDRKVIATAVNEGYFDFPRRISLRSISEMVNLPVHEVRKILES
jgi:DNA binding protein with HTH domain